MPIAFLPARRPTSCSAAGLGPKAVRSLPRDAPASDKCSGRPACHSRISVQPREDVRLVRYAAQVLALCFPSVRVRFDKTDFHVEL